jgi:hypothetical protein
MTRAIAVTAFCAPPAGRNEALTDQPSGVVHKFHDIQTKYNILTGSEHRKSPTYRAPEFEPVHETRRSNEERRTGPGSGTPCSVESRDCATERVVSRAYERT